MSEGKGSNINKFVKGGRGSYWDFEVQNLFCYSLRKRKAEDCISVTSINNIELLFLPTDSISKHKDFGEQFLQTSETR